MQYHNNAVWASPAILNQGGKCVFAQATLQSLIDPHSHVVAATDVDMALGVCQQGLQVCSMLNNQVLQSKKRAHMSQHSMQFADVEK